LVADRVAMQSAVRGVAAAVADEEAEAEIFGEELIAVAFEVQLAHETGKEHVPDADQTGDRRTGLVGRLVVVRDVALGAEEHALVDTILVSEVAAVDAAAGTVDAVVFRPYCLEPVAARQVEQAATPHVAVDVRTLELLVTLIGEIGIGRYGSR